ncbi:hypothetical protein, partial [Staphylococcus aureus]|uniref:hypothetical protein n=1 Tax=Staphylococcus aureus TaxID=1280 RepID=UPI003D0D2951
MSTNAHDFVQALLTIKSYLMNTTGKTEVGLKIVLPPDVVEKVSYDLGRDFLAQKFCPKTVTKDLTVA